MSSHGDDSLEAFLEEPTFQNLVITIFFSEKEVEKSK